MKKFLSLILVVIMISTIASVAVSAKTVVTEQGVVSVSNSESAKLAVVEKLVEKANARIESLVEQAMNEENPDLDKLVAKTNFIAQTTIKVAAVLGYEVVCDYVVYEINGVEVVIDPLIVIKR